VQPLKAQQEAAFCDEAVDTAQTISCLSKKLEFQQNELNQIFLELQKQDSQTQEHKLADIQKKWLAYRDIACMREKQWRNGDALARAYELSCLSELTQERLKRLNKELTAKDSSTLPEFTPNARWQTAIINDYPETFWNFAKTGSIDANCDNINDNITPGIKFHSSDDKKSVIFAIATLKETGRPHIQLHEDNDISPQCLENYDIKLEQNDENNCVIEIKFSNEQCSSINLSWVAEDGIYKIIPLSTLPQEENNL
jgi:uncharacterized protein YecT (DUF1311 family)